MRHCNKKLELIHLSGKYLKCSLFNKHLIKPTLCFGRFLSVNNYSTNTTFVVLARQSNCVRSSTTNKQHVNNFALGDFFTTKGVSIIAFTSFSRPVSSCISIVSPKCTESVNSRRNLLLLLNSSNNQPHHVFKSQLLTKPNFSREPKCNLFTVPTLHLSPTKLMCVGLGLVATYCFLE